ncbi:MAG: hypothetical protein BJ554DRAFT_1166 [Olpidium bornovanus]|uniref:Uncharacterized protein n=1 Tax=Olpidium bornovanus TaxID=278681 RepID=A0A8H7ZT47_9FUNG|nr:MAG: hypothetical protein BJ554DRAFT_1166 [Olpidium bornovanus]
MPPSPPAEDNNPGPAQYNIGTTVGTKVLTVVSNSPGPAMYNTPDASKRILRSAPAYSLGYRITKDPATGDSNLRMKPRQSPSFSFGVHHSEYEAFVPGNDMDVEV